MERLEIEAVYEHGTLRLPRGLPLQDGQKVTITIHPTGSAVERLVGLLPWHGSREDLDYLILSDDNASLQEGQNMTGIVQPTSRPSERIYGMIPWPRDPKELHRFLEDMDEG